MREGVGGGAARGAPPPLDAARHALVLDLDGTLLDIAPAPGAVVVPAALRAALARLLAGGAAVAVVSGRRLAAVDALLGLPGLPAFGLHGHEARGEAPRPDPAAAAALGVARGPLAAFVAARPGALLEDKGLALALHWRGAPGAGRAGLALARRLASASGGALVLQAGRRVAELRPVGADKGAALRALMRAPPFAGRAPLAFGDDRTDEAMFAAAAALGGAGVRVGRPRATLAAHRLPSPAALRARLVALAAPLSPASAA